MAPEDPWVIKDAGKDIVEERQRSHAPGGGSGAVPLQQEVQEARLPERTPRGPGKPGTDSSVSDSELSSGTGMRCSVWREQTQRKMPHYWALALAAPLVLLGHTVRAEDCVVDATGECEDAELSLRQLRGERLSRHLGEDQAAPTCAAYGCGEFVRNHPCQCTPQCKKFGNCCPDYQATCVKKEDAALGSDVDSPTVPEEDAAPSCASFGCSEKYVANHPCQCTAKCAKFGNCCSDFKAVCLAKEEASEAPAAPATTTTEAEVTTTSSTTAEETAAEEEDVTAEDATGETDDAWKGTVDGILHLDDDWIKQDKVAGECATAKRGDECFIAVNWAMSDGIYEHPEWWPELQAGASSFEEFQAHQHLMNATLCPQPCMVRYQQYLVPTYRSQHQYPMKGVSYGASPLKNTGVLLTDDDFMTDITGAMWDSWGRGDLDLLKSMGVNTLRMYGNDLNYSHRSFLDGAYKRDMDIIVGLSDWGFIQGPDPCDRNGYECFSQVYEAYKNNLLKGFTIRNYTMYHPALKALIISNEPDLKVHPRTSVCRAMISSLDAILQAEKDLNVTENPIAFTVTFSFAAFGKNPPGLGQMQELYHCLEHPEAPPTNYKPKNDVLTAFHQRWVHSFNTAAPGHVVEELFLDKYKKSIFWSEKMKIPLFIGEYHSVHVGAKDDLPILVGDALSPTYPFFLGYNFFEFSVRYDKGGSEKKFGMFGYGDCPLLDMNYSGQVYTIWDLVPAPDKYGYPLSVALSAAYGKGSKLPTLRKSPCMEATLGVS
ncbi:unnamed protein product [Durusdinium trenchii]|uniref:SMB domain-containing protein n=1 Tax=Durusdinium trenchii TaxID=1381693 RepID=A0ABP0SNW4_9DINO